MRIKQKCTSCLAKVNGHLPAATGSSFVYRIDMTTQLFVIGVTVHYVSGFLLNLIIFREAVSTIEQTYTSGKLD